jgi:hypothetical protein
MVALVFAILASVFGRAFGRIGDALVALTAVLSAGLAMLLFAEHRLIESQLALISLGLALAGGAIAAFGSVLAATEATNWFRAQLYVAAGYALMGVWLIILNISADAVDSFPNRAVNMGILAGAVMALGFAAIPGIVLGADSERSAPWLSRVVGRAGYLGAQALYPLWCIWLGISRL